MLRIRPILLTAASALALSLAACGQSAEFPADDSTTVEAEAPAEPGATSTEGPTESTVHPFCEEIGRRIPAADCEVFTELSQSAVAGSAAFNAPDPMQRGDVHTLQLAISFAPTPEQIAERERRARLAADNAAFAAAGEAAARATTPARAIAAYRGYLQAQPDGVHAAEARALIANIERQMAMAEERVAAAPERDGPPAAANGDAPPPPAPPPPPPPPPPLPPTPGEVIDPLQGETVEFEPLVGRFMRAELAGTGFEVTPLSEASQEVLQDSVTTWNWRVVAREAGRRTLTLTTTVEGCTEQGQCYPLRSTTTNREITVTVGLLGKIEDFLTSLPNWLRLLAGVLTALAVLVGAWFGLRNAFRKGRDGG